MEEKCKKRGKKGTKKNTSKKKIGELRFEMFNSASSDLNHLSEGVILMLQTSP